MKVKYIISGIALMSMTAMSCLGQGLVAFANSQASSPVYVGAGNTQLLTNSFNSNIRIGLFWGNVGDADTTFKMISPGGVTDNTVTNGLAKVGLSAGAYTTGSSYITGTSAGSALFQVRAWDNSGGLTWNNFTTNTANIGVKLFGVSSVITANVLSGAGTPPNVPGTDAGGTVHLLTYSAADYAKWVGVPEPATYALGLMGLGLVWLVRRRQA